MFYFGSGAEYGKHRSLDMITEEENEWDNALEEAMMYAVEEDTKDKGGK